MITSVGYVGDIFVDIYDLFLIRTSVKGNRKANVIYMLMALAGNTHTFCVT